MNLQAEKLFNLELPGFYEIVTDLNRINIIFLYNSEMNMTNIIKNLQKEISNSNVFEFRYSNIIKKNKNNIFIFEYDDIYFIHLLNELCNNIAINYLCYLFVFNHNSTREIDISYFNNFHKNHIYFFLYSNEILKVIINKYGKIQNQIKKNYSLYLTNRVKYYSITNEYNKLYKYEIFDDKEDKKYSDLGDIIEQYKNLFVEKIKQDLCFYLT